MLVRKVYNFPSPEQGMAAVEEKYLELLRKKREEGLDEEEQDYFDYANNALESR
jgi:hypothetical protein